MAHIRLVADAVEIVEGDSVQVSARLDGDVVLAEPATLSVEFGGVAQKDLDYEADTDELSFAAGNSVSDSATGHFVVVQDSPSNIFVPTEQDVGKYLKASTTNDPGLDTELRAETISSSPVGADLPSDDTTGGRIVIDGGPVTGYIDMGYVTFTIESENVCIDVQRVFDHDWWGLRSFKAEVTSSKCEVRTQTMAL